MPEKLDRNTVRNDDVPMSDSVGDKVDLYEVDSEQSHAPEEHRKHIDLVAEEPTRDYSQPQGNALLQVGVVFVIGAVAANVFGFRASRWAVGKDLHRAWERSSARRDAMQQDGRQADSKLRAKMPESDRSSSFRRPRGRLSNHMFNEFIYEANSYFRDKARMQEGPQVASRSGGSGGSARFKVESDNFDERFRNFRQQGRNSGASSSQFSSDDYADLAELLRAAHKAQTRVKVGNRCQHETDSGAETRENIFGTNIGNGQGSYTHSRTSSKQKPMNVANSSLNTAYRCLGLREGASKDEVKVAYRQLAIKFHPDTSSGLDAAHAASRFREITAAYRQLKDKS